MTAHPAAAHPAATGRPATRAAAGEGARAILPMVVAVVPFGLAIGAAIGPSALPDAAGWSGAPLILAGSAQLTALNMLDGGAAPVLAVLAAVAVNARLLVFGAGAARWFGSLPVRRRLLLAFPLIDQLYAVCEARFARGDLDVRGRQAFYAAAAAVLAASWMAAQAVGLAAGAAVPAGAGLDLAAPLAFAGLLARMSWSGPALAAGATAAGVASVGVGLPFHSSVLAAIAAGVAVGSALGQRGAAS